MVHSEVKRVAIAKVWEISKAPLRDVSFVIDLPFVHNFLVERCKSLYNLSLVLVPHQACPDAHLLLHRFVCVHSRHRIIGANLTEYLSGSDRSDGVRVFTDSSAHTLPRRLFGDGK